MTLFVNCKILASNPFFESFTQSDSVGKLIFIALFALSITTWCLLIYKVRALNSVKKHSEEFRNFFLRHKENILIFDIEKFSKNDFPAPFIEQYRILKRQTMELLNKNRMFKEQSEGSRGPYLSQSDIDFIQTHLQVSAVSEVKNLDRYLFVLSTVISLAPFLGLLGTVWGILVTFSQLQSGGGGNTNHMMLGGISLALTTTVIGLVVAIPALIGYNYLRNAIIDYEIFLQKFSNEILSKVEIQYREVDIQ